MAHKKIVMVIVEGPSDDTALGVMLSQLFDRNSVYVYIMHGDITTRKGVNAQNIVARLGNEIRGYARSQHYTAKNFRQVIHIVDTDGGDIPDEQVIKDDTKEEPAYESEGIYTKNPKLIIERNKQKRDNLRRLQSTGQIWNIPYQVYYMSCNLDHVLYDKRNSSDDEKEENSYRFAKKYRNDLQGFITYICKSDFSVKGDYKDSWKFIEYGLNSLERHTNFGICIEAELNETEQSSKVLIRE